MAKHTVNFHDEHGTITHQLIVEMWSGNRAKTTQNMLEIAQMFYAYLVKVEDEPDKIVLPDSSNTAIGYVDEIKSANSIEGWEKGAITMQYLKNGRQVTACFSRNLSLAKRLFPEETFSIVDVFGERFLSLIK